MEELERAAAYRAGPQFGMDGETGAPYPTGGGNHTVDCDFPSILASRDLRLRSSLSQALPIVPSLPASRWRRPPPAPEMYPGPEVRTEVAEPG